MIFMNNSFLFYAVAIPYAIPNSPKHKTYRKQNEIHIKSLLNTIYYLWMDSNSNKWCCFLISSLSLPLTISSVIFIHLFYTHAIFWFYEFILGTCMTLQNYTFYHLKFSADLHYNQFEIHNWKPQNILKLYSISFIQRKKSAGAQWNQFHAFKFPKNKIIYFNKIISLNKHCFPEICWYFFI